MMEGLSGAFAIVVGGSQGLGADVSRALHHAGADTIALSRRGTPKSTPWEQVAIDATDELEVDRFFLDYCTKFTERNLLVNFAGSRYNVAITASDPAAWRACIDSSLLTTYLMTRGFARAAGSRAGAIVNMASIHAAAAAANRSAYAAAKAAVVQFTAISAIELAPCGIRVNCIAPGFIATEASNDMIAAGKLDGAGIERRTPLGRLGDCEEVTDVVLFLLSMESRFITGETIRVDGGWLRHAEV